MAVCQYLNAKVQKVLEKKEISEKKLIFLRKSLEGIGIILIFAASERKF